MMVRAGIPPIGIVIANHNNSRFVGQAIESVARQTLRDIDVVIVDDASTDESDTIIREALSRLDDKRFHYIKLEANRGQAGAVRCGLTDLSAPFVCFLDSDDIWYETFLERHLAVHLNADFPVALSYCDSHIIDASGHLLAGTAWWFDFKPGESSQRVINPSLVPDIAPQTEEAVYAYRGRADLYTRWSPEWSSNSMAGMMFRRNFVELVLVPPDNKLALYLDFYLSTCAALLTGAISINDALYAYRMHGSNKHSDGVVLGGRYNPSQKKWQPIQNAILAQILDVLQSEKAPICKAFGVEHHEHAVRQIRAALRGRSINPMTRLKIKFDGLFRAIKSP